MSDKHVGRVSGSPLAKMRRFGPMLPWALGWYAGRWAWQTALSVFYRTLGRYAFRRIGRKVVIDGWVQIIWPCADIRLGDRVRIGRRCVFQGSPDCTINIGNSVTINDGAYLTAVFGIDIGERTSIGEYVSIRDYDHQFDDVNTPIQNQGYRGGPIRIGRDCWIGRGTIVTGGVTIGDGAVVGANSVVTRDIPPMAVAVGAPARVLRQRGERKK